MSSSRVFVPQETLETWLASGGVHMVGETLVLDGQPCELESAVRFLREVAEGPDEHQLVGRVKRLTDIAALGGELCAASVVLGDNAYEVVEGFLVTPDRTRPTTHERFIRLFAER